VSEIDKAYANRSTDDPKKYVGVPISLQLVGRRYEDENLVEGAKEILRVWNLDK
jgi:Asp-tRNA(Asn)/Glu-tRNA(Gln) amidotransferase A subunit family amidase